MLKFLIPIAVSFFLVGCGTLLNKKMDAARARISEEQKSGCLTEARPAVVLGGGVESDGRLSDFSRARVLGLVRFSESHPDFNPSFFLWSGGNGEAVKMSQLWTDSRPARLRETPVFLETASHNTVENAKFSSELFASKKWPKKIILLSGVLHIERAQQNFKDSGFEVCPAIIAGKDEIKEIKKSSAPVKGGES